MYFCLCNALKERDVACAIAEGARCVADVYAAYQCQPKCGKCVPELRQQFHNETLGTVS